MSDQRSQARSVVASILAVAAATAVYFVVPVPGEMHRSSWALMFFLGAAVLAALIVVAIRRLLRAGENARIRGLILLLTLTVLFFSWSDESVARLPGQFTELTSKTDSLYFNISTLATVGFGDVHPVGELARAAVTVQIVFNLVFLGTAVSLISGLFRGRLLSNRTGARQADTGHAGHEQTGTSNSAGSDAG